MSTQLFDLSGRLALVTGASRGIGEETAKLFAAQGAKVIVSSRKLEGCQAVADKITAAGGEAIAMTGHIGETEQIAELFEKIKTDHGPLNILVNNAAANPYFGPSADTPLEAFQKTVDVNIRGYFQATSLATKHMVEAGHGSIISTASVNGVTPGYWQTIYSMTKAAIINMTLAFAKEYGSKGIRVNAVLPGITDTKFASALVNNEKMLQTFLPHVPMGRVAEPSEIAPALLFLASDAASYVNGIALPVDGGYLA